MGLGHSLGARAGADLEVVIFAGNACDAPRRRLHELLAAGVAGLGPPTRYLRAAIRAARIWVRESRKSFTKGGSMLRGRRLRYVWTPTLAVLVVAVVAAVSVAATGGSDTRVTTH